MTVPQFRTITGRLTAYSFACGYIEQKSTSKAYGNNGLDTEMWKEHSTYFVRQHDRRNGAIQFRTFWDGFNTVAKARNCFNRAAGRLTTARISNDQVV